MFAQVVPSYFFLSYVSLKLLSLIREAGSAKLNDSSLHHHKVSSITSNL